MKRAMICRGGIYPNPDEGKPFPVDCDHCERKGVDLVLFGDQGLFIESAYAFVCEACLTESLANLRDECSPNRSPL